MDEKPIHAPDCALVTTHHLTCTCGATYRAVQEAKDRAAEKEQVSGAGGRIRP